MWHWIMSLVLHGLGQEDEALNECRASVELDQQFWIGWALLGILHAIRGHHSESLQCAERAMAIAAWSPVASGTMAAALANTGRTSEAEALLETWRSETHYGPLALALYSMARGDIDGVVSGQAGRRTNASSVSLRS
jgi:hypothetical protein